MKTVEVEPGTTFLLCSDGITRHIPDEELRAVLGSAEDLEAACAELKRLCFERGAEDNLTAVLVRVGEDKGVGRSPQFVEDKDDEVTLVQERVSPAFARTLSDDETVTAPAVLRRPFHDLGVSSAAAAPSPTSAAENGGTSTADGVSSKQRAAAARRGGGGAGRVFGVILLVLAAAAAAFYAGMYFQRRGGAEMLSAATTPAATPLPTPAAETPEQRFEKMRMAVDRSPAAEAARMSADSGNAPLDSQDPEFLYLYGRAMLLTGESKTAADAFEKAIQKSAENMTPRNGQLKIDSRLAATAARLRSEDFNGARDAARALDEFVRPGQPPVGAEGNTEPVPSVSP